ncbi:SGNH/GDSL hydrolase family protein [Nocardia uniformis]|uniref:SGNH/GDSL hydrolase family protein n=1 Tax=Nocardia uniformis TaxID=53432 RepID=A0A849C4I1_9NOCA|nr:GDSL-type esterase/lipase family protein [Nocardia uniformis]NNH69869.1 SGNH/GDSL hydrolase family protein [Nocardia uniformis]
MRSIAALFGALLVFATAGAATPVPTPGWQAVWATATQRPGDGFNWSTVGFENQSVRQVVRVSGEGSVLRVRLSNTFGTQPLQVSGATIARSAGGAAVHPDTLRPLTIEGETAFRIAAGTEAVTDLVVLPVVPLEALTMTLYFADPTGPATYHDQSHRTSYLAWDDHRSDTAGDVYDVTSSSMYYLAAVETMNWLPRRSAVAVFGDSFTEGVGSTPNGNSTFPDELAEQLAAQGRPRAVLNLGINGNCVTVDSQWLGDSALTRFRRDVLDQPGLGTVVIQEGINDIWNGIWLQGENMALGGPPHGVSAGELIAGYRSLIGQARAAGLRVIGATIPPVGGSGFDNGDRVRFAERDGVRKAVNDWIRTSGEYDAVADLAAALADPADRDRLAPGFDSGDHLHPNDAGHAAMAAAVAAVLD